MRDQTFADPACFELSARRIAFEQAWQQGRAELAEFLPPPDDPSFLAVLRELVRCDLRQRWQRSQPARLERYRELYPRLFEDSAELRGVAFEEYRRRVLAGEAATPGEYRERLGIEVGDWPPPHALAPPGPSTDAEDSAAQLGLLRGLPPLGPEATLALRRLARVHHDLPQIGDRILDFTLLRELGRGSFARVFLARQALLADRPVVLKISSHLDEEPWTLARLQHTHIVPIHSVHQAGSLQIVCMPYFGSITLAKLIADPGCGQRLPQTGREFLAPLFDRSSNMPPPVSLQRLAALDYITAALELTARLAEGLAHAHDRDILHCDLKPENVLMTDDGQPMLLDFNVSIDARVPAELRAARVGGTLPYMAPERLELIRDPRHPVDARSDLYSLGVILYRLVTGFAPFDSVPDNPLPMLGELLDQRRTRPIPPRRLNPDLSPAVDSIVRKLLEPDPQQRYRRAVDLVEDLERHLADRPLKFARDPSPWERLGKWRRRHPRLATVTLVAALVLPPLGLAAGLGRQYVHQQQQAEIAAAHQRLREALDAARAAIVHLSTQTGDRALLEEGLRRGQDVLSVYPVDEPDWQQRRSLHLLSPEQGAELQRTLGELFLLMARGERLRSGDTPDGLQRARRYNELAAASFPDGEQPRWLVRQRRELAGAVPGEGESPPIESVPATALDHYYDAIERATQHRHEQALERLIPFTEANPRHFVAWYVRGICHEGTGQLTDADAAFTICQSLQPDFAWAALNRGIVRQKMRRYSLADSDFTQALALKPGWDLARWHRALARESQGRFREAEADATAALEQTDPPLGLFFLRSKIRLHLGDREGADRDRDEGLRRTPSDALGWNTRGVWRLRGGDIDGAMADFDQAVTLNPLMREALQNQANVLAEYQHRPQEAVKVLDRLLDLYPDHTDARAGRGVYLARLGETQRAVHDAEESLRADSSPFRLYQIAGLYAQLSRHDTAGRMRRQALRLVARALAAGFDNLKLIDRDPDIEPIRNDPAFRNLLEHARGLQQAQLTSE